MKALLFSSLLLAATPVLAQQSSTTSASFPLKQANVIVVRTADSSSVAFIRMSRALVAAGYALEKTDKDAGYIATSARNASALKTVQITARIALIGSAEGTALEIRGNYQVPALGPGQQPIANRGMGGSPTAAAWGELQRIASLYPGGIVAYRREP